MTAEFITAAGTVLAAIAAVVGVAVAWVQLRGIKQSLNMSSLMAVLEIETQMNERKVHFDQCSAAVKQGRLDALSNDAMLIRASLFESAKENYFNAMDRLCYCILRGYLEDKDWRAEYRDAIHNVIKGFPDNFNEASPFRNIKQLNSKWQSE